MCNLAVGTINGFSKWLSKWKASLPSEINYFIFTAKQSNDSNRRFPFGQMKNKNRFRCQQKYFETWNDITAMLLSIEFVCSVSRSLNPSAGTRSQFTFRVNLFAIAGQSHNFSVQIRIKWASSVLAIWLFSIAPFGLC